MCNQSYFSHRHLGPDPILCTSAMVDTMSLCSHLSHSATECIIIAFTITTLILRQIEFCFSEASHTQNGLNLTGELDAQLKCSLVNRNVSAIMFPKDFSKTTTSTFLFCGIRSFPAFFLQDFSSSPYSFRSYSFCLPC